jgi:hypothetical protein
MTLVSVTAYHHSFGEEVEASNTPTIRRLTPSCRHQLLRIALIYADAGCEVAGAGGLMIYGNSLADAYAGPAYIGRILKGANPSELPVDLTTKATRAGRQDRLWSTKSNENRKPKPARSPDRGGKHNECGAIKTKRP